MGRGFAVPTAVLPPNVEVEGFLPIPEAMILA